MQNIKTALMEYRNLRFVKFASSSPRVMSAFSQDDLASNLKDFDLDADEKPLQRCLDLSWDVNTDTFLFVFSKLLGGLIIYEHQHI